MNYFSFPYKISGEKKTKEKIEKNGPYFCKESFKDSKTVFVLIIA